MITIVLQQVAIEESLINYIENLGVNVKDKKIDVDLTAGRGANGFSASITLSKKSDNPNVPKVEIRTVEPKIMEPQQQEVESLFD